MEILKEKLDRFKKKNSYLYLQTSDLVQTTSCGPNTTPGLSHPGAP